MIDGRSYTTEEIGLLYSLVEEAVASHTAIRMITMNNVIKPGDFFFSGTGTNGLLFEFNGLKWVENGEIYIVRIQPRNTTDYFPKWYPYISVNERTLIHSENLKMIKKENRYHRLRG